MKKDETTNTELNDEWADLENQKEVYGRIYRIISPLESVGRPAREFIGKVEQRVDEDYIGRLFGPGRYNVHYRVTRSDGSKFERDETMNIGQEYAKKDDPQAPVKQAPAATFGGLDLGAVLGGLTVEKITAIGAAVKMFRDLIAPPQQPQIDVTKLLEIIAANNRPQNISDAVLIQAMQSLQKQNTPPSLLQQMRELKEIKETLKDETADETDGEGGQMSFLIEQAFKYLPSLLAANKNNFQATGAQVRENPMVANLIRSNPDLAQEFIERAALTYGRENAESLARGFGLQLTPAPVQQTQENSQGEALESEAG